MNASTLVLFAVVAAAIGLLVLVSTTSALNRADRPQDYRRRSDHRSFGGASDGDWSGGGGFSGGDGGGGGSS